MHFASDNWAGAHPEIAENLAKQAAGYASAYGTSELDKQIEGLFNEIFEREVAVFFVATGTAANSLAITAASRPGGVTFAHAGAHMIADECGAPEYLSGGTRLCPVPGALGRMDEAALEAAIGRYPPAFIHAGQPAAISLTQSTEVGTIYELDHISNIGEIAQAHGMAFHMDGARFANALVSLDTSPAEMTWKRGIDMVSFGGTKNGCWCAEALVFMDPAKAESFPFLRKRAAQLFSKSRFIAAQFEAYFKDDLWLDTARHANAMATRLAGRLQQGSKARLAWEPQANEVFAILPDNLAEHLKEQGAIFYPWQTPEEFADEVGREEGMIRLVTSFATTPQEVDRFADLIG